MEDCPARLGRWLRDFDREGRAASLLTLSAMESAVDLLDECVEDEVVDAVEVEKEEEGAGFAGEDWARL